MNVNEMSVTQVIEQLNMMFDWKRRPHEGKLLQRALDLLKEQETTLNRLRSTMEDMVRGNASEEVSYLLRLMNKWEKM